jgi:hypothetical protein
MLRRPKSSGEVAAAVMNRIRERPELQKEIKGVKIRRMKRYHPAASNWEAKFEMIGYDNASRPTLMPAPHPLANQIVTDIQSQFDLVDSIFQLRLSLISPHTGRRHAKERSPVRNSRRSCRRLRRRLNPPQSLGDRSGCSTRRRGTNARNILAKVGRAGCT